MEYFHRQTDSPALGIVKVTFQSLLSFKQMLKHTKKSLSSSWWFRVVFRNLGKLAYVDSKNHKQFVVYGLRRVPPLQVLSKSQVIFQILVFADAYKTG